MNKKFTNYLKIKVKRKLYIQKEVKKKILKSIFQNQSVKPLKRQYSFFCLIKTNVLFLKIKNTCLISGRNSAVYKNFFLSRHVLKKMVNVNKLQNVKINS